MIAVFVVAGVLIALGFVAVLAQIGATRLSRTPIHNEQEWA